MKGKTSIKIFFLFLLLILFMGIFISNSNYLDGPTTAAANASTARPGIGKDTEGNTNTVTVTGTDSEAKTNTKEVADLPMSDSFSFIKSLMALTFVLGLIFLTAYLFKKITGIKTSGLRAHRVPIHLVGNLPLGDKKFLSIVEIQGKHYFLGISQNSVNLLSELDLELPQADEETNGGQDFIDIFRKARSLLKHPYRNPMRMKK